MIDENKIKESFFKMREHMLYLEQELIILRQEIQEIKQILHSNIPPAQDRHTTHNTTDNLQNYSLESQNFHSSIGNNGVPTDRQQTDRQHINTLKRTLEAVPQAQEKIQEIPETRQLSDISSVSNISNIIHNLKKDLGEKFKTLTKKEFLIFSILYTLEEELGKVTYSDIAQRIGLTESSIRDYIIRLINKGIPIIKEKLNNKVVILKIPKELKDISTLDKLSRLERF